MKNLTNKVKAWIQNIFNKEPSYGRKFLRPSRDWMIIFSLSVLFVIFCAFGAFYFYKKVDSGEYFTVTETNVENEAKINISLLTKTVTDLNIRAENLKKAEAGGIAPADPSK